MATQVSLMEAASYLGVSRATLRNWDKDGKLTATRNPLNGYRLYDLDELIALKQSIDSSLREVSDPSCIEVDSKVVKRIIGKLHNIIRDSDANSNIMTRFDEISKLLFIKLYAEQSGNTIFMHQILENDDAYKERLQRIYEEAIKSAGISVPESFSKITLSAEAVSKCGAELAKIDLSSAGCDVKGLAYEDTIKGTFDKSDNQQYFTPYQIIEFMVQMIAPLIKGCVCDPACGTAGFLNKVSELCPEVQLLGLEVDERLEWVSKLNLLIHGNENFKVFSLPNGGSLGEQCKPFFGKADIIITNPPFGSDYSDPLILSNFMLGQKHTSRRRGILFIEQAWNLLKEDGIVAIIIDQGVLNSGSSVDVREYILTHFEILAVVDLPETAFMPYASVSSSILVMKKVSIPVVQKSTFYAKSDCIGRKSNGDDDVIFLVNGSSRLNSDLPEILNQWRRYCSGATDLSADCFIANISENLVGDASLRLDFVYHHPFRKESQQLLTNCAYKLFSLAELCVERNESYIPSADGEATTIQFTGLANIESYTGKSVQVITPAASVKSAVKRYECGDIVFSKMRPSLRKVAVMPFENGGYVSSECSVFTVRKNDFGEPIISPELLCALIRSDMVYGQIMSCVTGIGRPRINNKDLRNIKIPVPPKETQEKALISLRATLSSATQLKEKANMLLLEAADLEQKALNNVAKTMFGE